MGIEVAGETPSLRGEFIKEIHRVLEHTQTPTWELAPNLLMGSRGGDWKLAGR